MLPGGGLGRHESPLAAAARELTEETGCVLSGARDVTMSIEALGGASNRVHVVVGSTADTPRPDGREVIEAAFFSPAALPGNAVAGLGPDLSRWLAAEA